LIEIGVDQKCPVAAQDAAPSLIRNDRPGPPCSRSIVDDSAAKAHPKFIHAMRTAAAGAHASVALLIVHQSME
jgi:hypothetical protein